MNRCARTSRSWPTPPAMPPVGCRSTLARARGRVILAAGEAAADLLARPELVELVARAFSAADAPAATVIEAGDHYPWQPLSRLEGGAPAAVAFAAGNVPRELRTPPGGRERGGRPCGGCRRERTAWSFEAGPAARRRLAEQPGERSGGEDARAGGRGRARGAAQACCDGAAGMRRPDAVPDALIGAPPAAAWAPPGTISVVRVAGPGTGTSVRINESLRPAEQWLGWARLEPAPGTIAVRHAGRRPAASHRDSAQEAVGYLEAEDVTGLDELLEVDDPLLGRAVMSSAEDPASRGARRARLAGLRRAAASPSRTRAGAWPASRTAAS